MVVIAVEVVVVVVGVGVVVEVVVVEVEVVLVVVVVVIVVVVGGIVGGERGEKGGTLNGCAIFVCDHKIGVGGRADGELEEGLCFHNSGVSSCRAGKIMCHFPRRGARVCVCVLSDRLCVTMQCRAGCVFCNFPKSAAPDFYFTVLEETARRNCTLPNFSMTALTVYIAINN